MSLAAFLPLRSPYPHQRSPPDTFSPRVHFSPRPVLAPMSRVPRIETASSSRRANNLPRDPSDWVDKDLLSYVRYNYSPIEAVPLSEVIERDRLTPTALWYLQSEPEQLLMIAEEESLRDTLLGLALSLKPAVSPTSPRIRHVRRLSEDLEHPPPPPPPPPPSPPTPEEPELEEDDDVAESVVSDWALDEDLDGDHGPTPTMDDLGDLAGSAAQPEPPVEGLGLHTGEPHLDDVTTPQPQPSTMETDDLINLEDDPQPTVPQEEAPEPHATRVDTGAADDPQVEEPTSSQSASTDARVPDAAGEKPPPGTHHHADPPVPLDDDLGNPWAEDTLGAESSTPSPPPPPPADPPRKVTPTSDYHDANSIHSDEGERQETLPAEQEPEPSPVHPEERDDPATSGDGIEDQPTTEAPLFTETPEKGETAENTSSGEDASTHEEAQLEENTAPASSEDPIEASSSAADPVQPTDPVQTAEPVHGPPLVTDPTELSPLTTDPVTAPPSEITETLEERVSPAGGPERDETAQVGADDSKDTQPEVPPVQSTTSGVASSEQSEETVEPEGRENGHLSGEDDANKTDGETVDKVDQEAVDEAGKDEEATVPPITTTEPAETTVPPVATAHTVNDSPVLDESSDKDASDVQANEQASSSETPAAQPEAEANSLSPAQDEDTSEKSSIPSGPSAAESTASPLLVTDTTPATTTISAPPSPTVRLASGIEAQLVNLDPDSTEQTPSASPSDTPPGASSSPSESRQASPPAQAEAEKPVPPATRVRMSSSSSSLSSTNPIEGKPPAPPPINTAFGSFSEPPRRARPPADPLTDNNPSAFRSTLSPATAKSVGWGSAQSPTAKGTGSWGRGLFSSVSSSVSSLFNPASEPSSREPSQERETPYPRMLVPPAPVSARPSLAARSSPRGQSKPWAAVASSSTSSQQASKLKSPDVSAAEPSFNVGPAQVLPPTDTKSTIEPPAPTLPPAPVAPPPEKSAIQETNPRAEEVTDVMSDSVLVDPETPSVGNGEPARDAESSRAPPVRAVASSEGDSRDSGNLGGKEETEDVEDEDMVKVTADDAAGADKAGAESQPQGDVAVDDDDNDDDDDNLPLNRRLERVRQITGDSVSTAVTSDTEAQDDDQQSSRRMGPKLRTSGLANAPDGVDSPVVDSPITPLSKSAKKRKNKKKNKAQGGP